jgi:hypothetical protein
MGPETKIKSKTKVDHDVAFAMVLDHITDRTDRQHRTHPVKMCRLFITE